MKVVPEDTDQEVATMEAPVEVGTAPVVEVEVMDPVVRAEVTTVPPVVVTMDLRAVVVDTARLVAIRAPVADTAPELGRGEAMAEVAEALDTGAVEPVAVAVVMVPPVADMVRLVAIKALGVVDTDLPGGDMDQVGEAMAARVVAITFDLKFYLCIRCTLGYKGLSTLPFSLSNKVALNN